MKKEKIVTKIFMLMLAGIVLNFAGIDRVSANNYKDTSYNVYYTGDGGDVRTVYRSKTDSTSVYVRHGGSASAMVAIRVSGASLKNFTWSGNYVRVPLGQGYKISNRVYETYKKTVNICLDITPGTHSPSRVYGVWSPDSI